MYWYLCLVTVMFYVSILSINIFISSIIIDEWLPKENDILLNQQIAAQLMSTFFFHLHNIFPRCRNGLGLLRL